MNVRIAIVLIVGSIIEVSAGDDAVAAGISSTTTTSNVKKCHLIDDKQSEFDVLVQCEKKELEQPWIFGVKMSEIAKGTKVKLSVTLQDASSDHKLNNVSHIREDALEYQKMTTTEASARVPAEKKIVKKYHPLVSNITYNWEDAAKACETKSWKLASIETEEENSQVAALLNDKKYENNHYWISAYEPVLNKGFTWKFSEKPLSYTNWALGEPNRAFVLRYKQIDRCVEILGKDFNFRWNDAPCNSKNPILCEERI